MPSRQRIIDEAVADAGRDPRTLRRVYNVIGDHGDGPGLVGDVRRWADTLAEWAVELGFDTFVFWLATDLSPRSSTAHARRHHCSAVSPPWGA
ncbi:hypothetical protein [Streptomyces sp. NPDC056661]|uniref:hypothetical protein n=1 Tax=Streptomyces sp. NPDC056661 TaxID=3345898 RepID=UPI003681F98B